jgi:hypothetical protein
MRQNMNAKQQQIMAIRVSSLSVSVRVQSGN